MPAGHFDGRRAGAVLAGMTAAILAGGASTRMGEEKALVPIEGRPMILHVAAALRGAGLVPAVVGGRDPGRFVELGLEVVPDRWPGEGPLGGILTALGALGRGAGRGVVVVACDMPAIDPLTVASLLRPVAEVDAVVGVAEGVRQPLLSRYLSSAEVTLRELWEQGERAPSAALDSLRVAEVVVSPHAATSVDTPADRAATEGWRGRAGR